MKKVIASKSFEGYNYRRHGRPWLAVITSFTGQPDLEFLPAYNGSDTGGEIVAELEVGQIVKIGQKDYRKPRGGLNAFFRVTETGEFELVENAKDARKLWITWQEVRESEK